MDFVMFLRRHKHRIYGKEVDTCMEAITAILIRAGKDCGHLRPATARVPATTLGTWKGLLFNKDFADCTFLASGETLHAHKCVLAAASPYFTAMFSASSDWMESQGTIKADKPAAIMKAVLRFVYTGELSESLVANQTVEIFCAAAE